MTDPLTALLQAQGLEANAFPASSRYHGLATSTLESEAGPIVYLRRRFVPPPERFADVGRHTVVAGDRLDLLASRYLGDPEQFWRLADANRAVEPAELTAETGCKLRITLPEGVPGVPESEG